VGTTGIEPVTPTMSTQRADGNCSEISANCPSDVRGRSRSDHGNLGRFLGATGDGAINLHIGRRYTGVSVRPDFEWPGMWRVHQGDRVSDMTNPVPSKGSCSYLGAPTRSWFKRGCALAPSGNALNGAFTMNS
jgi:hypothetical protein